MLFATIDSQYVSGFKEMLGDRSVITHIGRMSGSRQKQTNALALSDPVGDAERYWRSTQLAKTENENANSVRRTRRNETYFRDSPLDDGERGAGVPRAAATVYQDAYSQPFCRLRVLRDCFPFTPIRHFSRRLETC